MSHELGTGTPVFGGAFSASMLDFIGDLFIGVGVDSEGNQVLPRIRLDSVPFALRTADNVSCFGDGSAGAKNVISNIGLTSLSSSGNYQFTDVTITAGHTLTVDSGTILRCTGTFQIDGTINVVSGAMGGDFNTPAHPGVSRRAAGIGRDQVNSVSSGGGQPGEPLTLNQARNALLVGPTLGGGAGGGDTHVGFNGGGSMLILARNAVVCSGTINANGGGTTSGADVNSGGGAGGLVILASAGSVSVNGFINAVGGDGAPSAGTQGLSAGGGGGGGIVHLISPNNSLTGTVSVAGGNGGAGDLQTNTGNHRGGGGGGACGGRGGQGGGFSSSNGAQNGSSGQSGLIIQTAEDPTALFK